MTTLGTIANFFSAILSLIEICIIICYGILFLYLFYQFIEDLSLTLYILTYLLYHDIISVQSFSLTTIRQISKAIISLLLKKRV